MLLPPRSAVKRAMLAWAKLAFALAFTFVAGAGCYRSHGLADRADAAAPAAAVCEFSYTTPEGSAHCTVASDAEESCVEAARCICAAGLFPEWDGLDCVESALVLRALVTFGDYCNAPGAPSSLGDAVVGVGEFWGAEVEAWAACDDIVAHASYPRPDP